MDSRDLTHFATRLAHLMDGGGVDLDFNGLALELFQLQFAHNSAFASVCRAQGRSPDSVRHWREIPALPTVAFKELEVTAVPPGSRLAVFHSSGTTRSQPSRHFHCAESLQLYEASARAWFNRHVPPTGRVHRGGYRVWSLTPPPASAPHSSLVHMFAAAGDWLGDSSPAFWGEVDADGAWRLNDGRLLAALRAVEGDDRPVILLGTAFLFVHGIDAWATVAQQTRLPPGSVVLETGGYKGRSRVVPREVLHAELERWLGVAPEFIVCEYGMSELSSQAYALRDSPSPSLGVALGSNHRLFRFPPWVRTEVLSPETGKEVADGTPGLLRIWDLANVWSVMGIQTEDLATSWSGAFELHGRAAAASPRGCSLMAA